MIEADVFKQQDLLASPGAMLRKAREAKKMDIVAVAAMLHLTEFRIMAIEADDFDSLPEPVFVRGYLKNYARLLNEPAGPILEAYAKCTSEVVEQYQPERKAIESRVEGWISGDHDLVKMVSILLIVAAIAFPVVWWWDDLGSLVGEIANTNVSTEPELAIPEQAPTEDNNDPALSDIKPLAIPGNDVATSDDQVVQEDKDGDSAVIQPLPEVEIKPIESAVKEIEPPAAESNSISIPIPQQVEVVEEKKPVVEAEPKRVVATISVPVPPPAPAPKPTANTAVTHKGVWFNFVGSGWVKVRDAKDRVILIGDYEKGTRKKLTSVMPYKVVLGNSNAVQVEVDGKLADVDRFSSGGVARFTINDGKIEKP